MSPATPADFSGAQPSWPAEAVELWSGCAAEAARDTALWRAPAPAGDDQLRTRLGAEFGLDPAHLTVVAGARAVALTYGRCTRRVLVERPTFLGLSPMLRAHGARVRHFGWADIPVPEPDTTVLVTSPCRNPDGATLDGPTREVLEGLCRKGVHVAVNGAYVWFDRQSPRVAGADLFVSLHKLAGVGARLGFVFSESFFERGVPEIASTGPPPVWQRAWARFLARDGLRLLEAHIVSTTLAAARVFLETLAGEGAEPLPPATGPNLLLPLPSGTDEDSALAALAERGFLVSAGRHFASAAPAIRVTFTGTTRDQAAALAETLVRTGLAKGQWPCG